MLFTDCGRGFDATGNGKISAECKEVLQKHKFERMMADDGAEQPGNLSEVLLHRKAVSWMRVRLRNSTPSRSWGETCEAYGNRLKLCCDQSNKELKVEELCRTFPTTFVFFGGRGEWSIALLSKASTRQRRQHIFRPFCVRCASPCEWKVCMCLLAGSRQ